MSQTWRVQSYGSGTVIVTDGSQGPWLYVYGPRNEDDTAYVHNRHACAEQIAGFLNGGPRPAWLDDLERSSEIHAEDLDGTSVSACGPMIDRNPPAHDWVTDQSDDSKDSRARLMDRLFLVPAGEPENVR